MRILFTLVATILTVFSATAQVSGLVKDADGKPLAGVTVSLLKDTTIVKLAATKENGVYSFENISEGTYKIKASHIAYVPAVSGNVQVKAGEVRVPDITISKASGNLAAVTVTARKPIVEVKADKTILNVEGTINATGSDALELLRRAPGVMVDKDDNLSVSGKNGVQVFIDGRPSPLSGQDLANYLKTLQATQIEAIEIITNPSARYEAAGNAGIINIRLVKNKAFGTNGSVTAGYNIGVYPKYNGGFSLNHRNKNINVYGNYNYNNMRMESTQQIDRSVLDTLFNNRTYALMSNKGHNVKAGIDYTINKNSSIGAIVTGNFSDMSFDNNSRTPITSLTDKKVDRILVANNTSISSRDNMTYNLNYNYTGAKGKNLTVNADHGTYNIHSNQYQPNIYLDPTGMAQLYEVNYRMIAPTDITITSGKADYEQELGKGKISFGGKVSFVTTDNDFRRYNVQANLDQIDLERSNRFRYEENINAIYASYNRQLKGVMIQGGLRVENTEADGTSTSMRDNSQSGFERSYTDFFPSAAVTFNKNPMKVWNFTYSRRIDRPFYQDLNPFELKLDEYTFMKGNIDLRPQYTNSIGVTHTYKYKLNASLNYSHVKDIFTQLIDTTERSKSFISKRNLATQDVISLNVSYPFMYKTFMSFVNVNTNYSMYKADFGEGREVDIEAAAFSLYSQNTYKFGKTKTWTAELTGFYNAPTVHMGTFRAKSMWGIDAGIQKQLMKGKATIKASVSDIFRTLRFRGENEFAGQKSNFTSQWESRQLKLNFTYRFGNSQVKAAKQRSTAADEEAKRVQQGSGGMGIGGQK
jgi:iron complex outermembrane receptor protein